MSPALMALDVGPAASLSAAGASVCDWAAVASAAWTDPPTKPGSTDE
jgi:hypothetical protein